MLPANEELLEDYAKKITKLKLDFISHKLTKSTFEAQFETGLDSDYVYYAYIDKTPEEIRRISLEIILSSLQKGIQPCPVKDSKLNFGDGLINRFAYSIDNAFLSYQMVEGKRGHEVPILGHDIPFSQDAMAEIASQMRDFIKTIMRNAVKKAKDPKRNGNWCTLPPAECVEARFVAEAAREYNTGKSIREV